MWSEIIKLGIFRTYIIFKAVEPDEITKKNKKELAEKLVNITSNWWNDFYLYPMSAIASFLGNRNG